MPLTDWLSGIGVVWNMTKITIPLAKIPALVRLILLPPLLTLIFTQPLTLCIPQRISSCISFCTFHYFISDVLCGFVHLLPAKMRVWSSAKAKAPGATRQNPRADIMFSIAGALSEPVLRFGLILLGHLKYLAVPPQCFNPQEMHIWSMSRQLEHFPSHLLTPTHVIL